MEVKQVIILRKDLNMSVGKAVAQASHASLEAYLDATVAQCCKLDALEWRSGSKTKIALAVNSEQEIIDLMAAAFTAELPFYLVQDEGRTELTGKNYTCLAIGPANGDEINKVTGRLKLY